MSWWLQGLEGVRLRIDAGGMLIGRSPGCAIVVRDPRTSSVHALVRVGPEGPELRVLGRNPIVVGGVPVERQAVLRADDVLELPGTLLRVMESDAAEVSVCWAIHREQGGVFGLSRTPYAIGSGEADHLHVAAWPAGAVQLHLADGAVWGELAPTVEVDGRPASADGDVQLYDGARLSAGGETITLRAEPLHGDASVRATTHAVGGALVRASLSFMPSGGRLVLETGGRVVLIDLPELRARLVACLLAPPAGYQRADFVPDDVVIGKVWPRQSGRTHLDVNTLVHRLRRDLLRAGLDPASIVERSRQGGGTRVLIGGAGTVEVR